MTYQLPKVYPDASSENLTIAVSTKGARAPFSALITRDVPDLYLWVDDTPCFPLYIFDTSEDGPQASLLEDEASRRHNVTGHALDLYRGLDPTISKDDILLHSSDYREAFAADLKKSIPRIPKVDTAEDFSAFSRAGRELALLHTEYEEIEPWSSDLEVQIAEGLDTSPENLYQVTKMRYLDDDKTAIVYNEHITISGIPERVHDYQLGARSALDWVLETNRVRKDKKSGIVNDPNDWAIEHDKPSYIFDLVGQVVAVSIRTLDVIEELPRCTDP